MPVALTLDRILLRQDSARITNVLNYAFVLKCNQWRINRDRVKPDIATHEPAQTNHVEPCTTLIDNQ
jgi:hypothetical protein